MRNGYIPPSSAQTPPAAYFGKLFGSAKRRALHLVGVFAILALASASAFAQVALTASAGTATGSFSTISGAFAAINAGTHQGIINITINGNVTETATPTFLTGSGVGSAVYTRVNIGTSGVYSVTGTMTGNTTGRPVLGLNGADSVFINGSSNGTSSRDLTFRYANALASADTTGPGVVIWVGGVSAVNPCNNVTIQNCNIRGNSNPVNNSRTSRTQFGIYAGPFSTSSPSATSTGFTGFLKVNNNLVSNTVNGIHLYGTSTSPFSNFSTQITNNTIGATNEPVKARGITLYGTSFANVTGNNIVNMQNNGFAITGIFSSFNRFATINGNSISNLRNFNSVTAAILNGIELAFSNEGTVITNNLIFNFLGASTNSFSSPSIAGIRISSTLIGGTTRINNNTVYFYGNQALGSTTNASSAAFVISTTSLLNLEVRNNIFANVMTAASTTYRAIGAYFTSTPIWNNIAFENNAYVTPPTNGFVAQVGTTNGTNSFATLTAWNGNTLSAPASQKDRRGVLLSGVPFVSSTPASNSDLQIASGFQSSLLESGSFNVGLSKVPTLATDFAGTTRATGLSSSGSANSAADIGAYEFNGTLPTCSNTPVAAIVVGNRNTANICNASGNNTAFTVATAFTANALAPYYSQSNYVYNWQYSTTGGGSYTNIPSAGTSDTLNLATGGLPLGTNMVRAQITCGGTTVNSAGLSVTVGANAAPVAPTISNNVAKLCAGIPAATFNATNADVYNVYNAAGTTLLYTVTPTTLGGLGSFNLVNATTTFQVAGSNGGCEGIKTSVTINITPADAITVASSGITTCKVTLTATQVGSASGTYTYTWGPENAGLLSSTGTSVDAAPKVSTTYTVVGTDNVTGCSNVGTITVSAVTNAPVQATITPSATSVCNGGLVTLTNNGTASLSSAIGAGSSNNGVDEGFVIGYRFDSKIQYLYTAAELTAAGLVAGPITSITLTVTSASSSAPRYILSLGNTGATAINTGTGFLNPAFTTVFTANAYNIGTGTKVINFNNNFIWDGTSNVVLQACGTGDNGSGVTQTGTSIADRGMYGWSSGQTNSCQTTFTNTGNCSIRPNAKFGTLSPLTATWSGAGLNATSGSSVTANPTTTTTYTASYTGSGCNGTAVTTITVNPLPGTGSASGNAAQCGAAIPAFTISATSAVSYNFYSDAAGTVLVGNTSTGKYYTTIAPPGATVYARPVGSNGCTSGVVSVAVVANSADTIAITPGSGGYCLPSAPRALTATQGGGGGYTYTYTWAPSTGLSATTGATVNASPSVTTTYTVTGVGGGCSNVATVTLTVVQPISTPTVTTSAATSCSGATVTLKAFNPSVISNASTIGAGSATTGSNAEGFMPSYWRDAKSQYLFTASELTAAGIAAGAINALSFNITATAGTVINYTIGMANTAATTLNSTTGYNAAALTTVYTSASLSYPGPGVKTLPFSSNFIWDGTSNVLIQVCGTGDFGSAYTQTATTIANRGISGYSSTASGSPCTQTLTTSSPVARPNLTFGVPTPVSGTWSGAGLVTTTGSTVTATPTATTTYTFNYNVSTCTSPNATVTITVPAAVGTLVVSGNTTHCGTAIPNFTLSATNATVYNFYNDASKTTLLGSTATGKYYTPTGSTTVYATAANSTGCETPVSTIVVNSTPADAITFSQGTTANYCIGNSGQPITAVQTVSGGYTYTYTWLPAAGLNTTTGATVSATPSVTTVYTVTGIGGGCSSTATFTVNSATKPSVPAVRVNSGSLTKCGASGSVSLTAVASSQTGGTLMGTGSGTPLSLTSTYGIVGAWYKSQRSQLLYTAAELAAAGFVNGSSISGISTVFTDLGDGSATPYVATDNYTIRAANVTAGTNFTGATVPVNPAFTTVFTAASIRSGPGGNIIVGTNTFTFSTPFLYTGGNLVLDFCMFIDPTTTYNRTAVQNTTTTSATSVIYNYTDNTNGTICSASGDGTFATTTVRPDISLVGEQAGVTYSWTPGTGLSSTTASTVTATPSTTTTYTVRSVSPGGACTSNSKTVTITVNPVPDNVAFLNEAPQCGTAVPSFQATSSNNNAYRFYAASTGGSPIYTSTSGYGPITSATTTYWATGYDSITGCESATRVSTVVTVTTATSILAAGTGTRICSASDAITLSVTSANTNYTYTWAPSAGLNQTTGDQVVASPNTTTVYTVTAYDATTYCSATSTYTVNYSPTSFTGVVSNVGGTNFCGAASTVLTANQLISNLYSSAATTTLVSPFYNSSKAFKQQVVYQASELTAAGIQAGLISALQFSPTSSASGNITNFSVNMANANVPSGFTSGAFFSPSFTNVLNATTYVLPTATGTNAATINFTSAFAWDGTSDIVVQFCGWNTVSASSFANVSGTTLSTVVNAISTTSTSSADLATICSASFGAVSTVRPNIAFVQGGITTFAWSPTVGLSSSTTPTTTATPATSTVYTVTATSSGGCVTTQTVSLSVNPIPAAPTANVASSSQCGAAVPTVSVSGTSSEMRWYSAATGGTLLQTGGLTYTSTVSTSPTTLLYVERNVAGCASATRRTLTVNVTAPVAVSVGNTTPSYCGTGSSTLSASSAGTYSYTWAPSTGLSSTTGASVTATPTVTTTYTLTATGSGAQTGCAVVRTTTVTVGVVPLVASISPTQIACVGGTGVQLNVSSNNVPNPGDYVVGTGTSATSYTGSLFPNYWYGARNQFIYTATELNAAGLTAGNISKMAFTLTGSSGLITDYTVRMANTAATSLTTGADFINPAFTTVYTNASLSGSAGPVVLSFQNNFTWDGTSNILVQVCGMGDYGSAVFTTGSTVSNLGISYYTSTSGTTTYCTSDAANATESVRPNITFTKAGYTVLWTPSLGLSSTTITNPIASPSVNTTYTVVLTLNGCSSAPSTTTVNVSSAPAAPTAGVASASQCGVAVPTVSVTGTSAQMRWFSASTGGTLLQTGGLTYTSTISSTTTFYVGTDNGCASTSRVALTQTVTTPNAVTITPSSTTPGCAGVARTLTASGTGYNQFTWLPATGLSSTTGAAVSAAPTSTTTYTVTARNTGNGCQNVRTYTIVVYPSVVATATATPGAITLGQTTTLGVTLPSGSAAVTSGSSTGYTLYTYYGNGRAQSLILASELQALGVTPGNITSMAWNPTTLPAGGTLQGFTLKMANTSATSLVTTFDASTATTVFNGNYTPSLAGFAANRFTFSAPFVWNGSSNIILEACYGNNSTFNPSFISMDWAGGSTSFTSGSYYNSTSSTSSSLACSASTATSTTSFRPNMQFTYASTGAGFTFAWTGSALSASNVQNPIATPTSNATYTVVATPAGTGCAVTSTVAVTVATCIRPATFTTSALTPTGVTFNWSSVGAAVSYEVSYSAFGMTPTVVTVASPGTSTVVTGLTSNSTYSYQIRTLCSGGDVSAYSPVATFKTPPTCEDAINGGLNNNNIVIPYVTGNGVTTAANNVLTAANSVAISDNSYYAGREVTYKFTAPTTGTWYIDFSDAASTINPVSGLVLYNGCPLSGNGGTVVAQVLSAARTKTMSANLTAGTTYYLMVTNQSTSIGIQSFRLAISRPNTFLGLSNNVYTTALNWSGSVLPVAGANITIPAAAYNAPNLIGSITVNDLTVGTQLNISSAATITILGNVVLNAPIVGIVSSGLSFTNTSANQSVSGTSSISVGNLVLNKGTQTLNLSSVLNVSNVVTLTAGTLNTNPAGTVGVSNLVLTSDATSTGKVARVTTPANVTVTGNVRAQRWFDPAATNKVTGAFFMVGAQVGNQTLGSFQYNNALSGLTGGTGSGSASVFKYNAFSPTGVAQGNPYYTPSNISETMPLGTGAYMFFRYPQFFVSNSGVSELKGTLQVGDFTWTNLNYCPAGGLCSTQGDGPSVANGYNLVANPFACPIDWSNNSAFTRTNVGGAIYVWSFINKRFVSYVNGTPVTATMSPILAQGQGFFVQATGASNSLVAQESAKVTNNTNLVRQATEAKQSIRMVMTNATEEDGAVIIFQKGATRAFDAEFDANKFLAEGLNVGLVPAAGLKQSIATMPMPAAQDSINVLFTSATVGTHTLAFSDLESLGADFSVYLKDKYTGTVTNVRQSSVYSFVVTSDPASHSSARFVLVYGNSAAAPVANLAFNVYPNPTSGSTVNVVLGGAKTGAVSLSVIDATGRIVYAETVNTVDGVTLTKGLTLNIPSGMYTVKLVGSDFNKEVKLAVTR